MHPPLRIRTPRHLAVLALSASALVMTACASVPKSQTLTPLAPDALAASQSLAGSNGAWPDTTWWTGFNDPQLNSLMDEALKGSPDLLAAKARLDKAASVSTSVRAALDPDLTLNGSSQAYEQSLNMGFPPAFQDFLPKGYWNLTRITVDANYNLDLWGKSRAALKAAVGAARASQLDIVVARTSITTALARSYVELDRLYTQRDALADLKRGADIKTELTEARVKHHIDSKDALLATQDDQAQLVARIAAIEGMIKVQSNQIAALTGAGPDRGLSITRPHLTASTDFALPQDAHLGLLARRPDVQAALLRVEAQAQGLKYARADYYPDVRLSAFYGVQALSKGGIQNLFQSGSEIGGIGPAVSLPLFHQKRLDASYHGYEADYDTAVAGYDKAVIEALQQVADAGGRSQATAAELAAAGQRVTLADQAYQMSKARFAKGLATKMDVLSAHARVVAAESAVSDLKAQAYGERIAFIAALGGGYTSTSSSGDPR